MMSSKRFLITGVTGTVGASAPGAVDEPALKILVILEGQVVATMASRQPAEYIMKK